MHFRPFRGGVVSQNTSQLIARTSQCLPLPTQPKRQRTLLRAEEEEKADSSKEEATWKVPLAGSDTDWRTFRARLVAGESAEAPAETTDQGSADSKDWAHAIAQPERGCLVLAHPLMFKTHQQYFDQAVILLTQHNETGTVGLILNKPLHKRMGSISGAEALMPEFNDNPLFLGGDVGGRDGENLLHLLHNQRHLPKSLEIVDGVYMGGIDAARMAIRKEVLDPLATCRWYCRFSGWAPGQLQSEIEKGVWFTVAASPELILHPTDLTDSNQHWHAIMQKIGGEYKQLSDALEVDANVNWLQKMVDAEEAKEKKKEDDSAN